MKNLLKKGFESIGEISYDLKGGLEMAKYCDFFLRLKENGKIFLLYCFF